MPLIPHSVSVSTTGDDLPPSSPESGAPKTGVCTSSVDSEAFLHPTSTRATVHLAKESLMTGLGGIDRQSKASKKQGFAVPADALEECSFPLTPISPHARLSKEGVELMDLSTELAAAGVTESCDLHDTTTRQVVGEVLLAAVECRFGKRTVHLADTSRVNGGAKYGEVTARDTGSGVLRNAHHVFHLDKFWPGVTELYAVENEEEAVRATIKEYAFVWGEDWQRLGVEEEEGASACLGRSGMMLQVWMSLTPGEITQHPLALVDRSSLSLTTETTTTQHVIFEKLSDTIALLKASAASDPVEGLRVLWRPRMKFGEAFVFLTTGSPHSAVWVEGEPDARRRSAEMRLLLLDR
uniref:Uncharacterized protein n=1 Tax=Chromera velia CCMP2878 TaxID=1169474 RepID=A0A0G4GNC4_9ALVE|eukprot:Cvel_4966.t1-p1 / transcript=Cvel_4966.t1 / gene=Cvel_4966 / organism=Chromera_velia_CCMP2878 / gene_product=hypothetical protein / transcript_product=hypothetical protein / location=Cvel_scaffold224:100075-101130(+) / protein_length=352 / sequence_SO=supercontig / SO=protein_coding / is_pseudo=false